MSKLKLFSIFVLLILLSGITIHSKNVTAEANSSGEIVSSHLVFDSFGKSWFSDKILFSVLSDRLTLYLSSPKENWERKITDDLAWSMWAPNGDRFIFWTAEGQLYIVDASNRKSTPKLLAQEITTASFSPGGQSLAILRSAFDSNQPGIYLYDLNTQREDLLTKEIATGIGIRGYTPLWSPDGRYILFLRSALQEEPYPFGIMDTAENLVYPLQSDAPLPTPTSPLYLVSNGFQFTYGTESMDDPSIAWTVQFDFSEGEVNDVQQNSGYWPVGLTEAGTVILAESADKQEVVDASLLAKFAILEFAPEVVNLYSVKYKSPIAASPNSFFSHSNTDPYANGTYNYFCNNQYRSGHKGTDFGAGNGTNIKAGATGVVEFFNNGCLPHDNTCPNQSGNGCNGGFGNYVRVLHSNGARTYYAHMKNVNPNLTTNQTVSTSTILGYVGSSGNSSGCHLHFEIRYPTSSSSNAVDPYYGPCNWITQSLWVGPQPLSKDE